MMKVTGEQPSDLPRIGQSRPGRAARCSLAVTAASFLLLSAAGCAAVSPSSDPSSAATSPATRGQRIEVRFNDEVTTATLADTAAGREFAALLPVTLELRDPMGQAKSGRLPAPIGTVDPGVVFDPDAGGVYYAPDSQAVTFYYDDLGQTVPAPGLVRLGSVDSGLASIAAARNRVRVHVELSGTAPS